MDNLLLSGVLETVPDQPLSAKSKDTKVLTPSCKLSFTDASMEGSLLQPLHFLHIFVCVLYQVLSKVCDTNNVKQCSGWMCPRPHHKTASQTAVPPQAYFFSNGWGAIFLTILSLQPLQPFPPCPQHFQVPVPCVAWEDALGIEPFIRGWVHLLVKGALSL